MEASNQIVLGSPMDTDGSPTKGPPSATNLFHHGLSTFNIKPHSGADPHELGNLMDFTNSWFLHSVADEGYQVTPASHFGGAHPSRVIRKARSLGRTPWRYSIKLLSWTHVTTLSQRYDWCKKRGSLRSEGLRNREAWPSTNHGSVLGITQHFHSSLLALRLSRLEQSGRWNRVEWMGWFPQWKGMQVYI